MRSTPSPTGPISFSSTVSGTRSTRRALPGSGPCGRCAVFSVRNSQKNQPAAIQAILMAREEISLLAGLWGMAAVIIAVYGSANRDAFMWATLLVVQSLPYLSAFLVSLINAFPGFHFG